MDQKCNFTVKHHNMLAKLYIPRVETALLWVFYPESVVLSGLKWHGGHKQLHDPPLQHAPIPDHELNSGPKTKYLLSPPTLDKTFHDYRVSPKQKLEISNNSETIIQKTGWEWFRFFAINYQVIRLPFVPVFQSNIGLDNLDPDTNWILFLQKKVFEHKLKHWCRSKPRLEYEI